MWTSTVRSRPMSRADVNVSILEDEVADRIAHRGRAVAASSGLVEHEGAVRPGEAVEEPAASPVTATMLMGPVITGSSEEALGVL